MFNNLGKINDDLGNLAIGGYNYLQNSDFSNIPIKWAGSNSSKLSIITGDQIPGNPPPEIEFAAKNESTAINGYTVQSITLEPGAQYTLSAWVYVPSSDIETSNALSVWYVDNGSWKPIATESINSYDKWHKIWISFRANKDYPETIVGFGQTKNDSAITYSTLYKLERYNTPTDWTPSIEDLILKITSGLKS